MSHYRRKVTSAAPVVSTVAGSTAKDVVAPADATDTISALRWSPTANHLAAACWDGKVRIYDVAKDGKAQGVAMVTAEGPAFSCDWSKDGTMIAAGGADMKIHVLQASSGQTISFAAHKKPIRAVRFVNDSSAAVPIIASGSWDNTVSYWDVRNTASPVATLMLGDRVYAMDSAGQRLVIATADSKVHLVDLKANPAVVKHTMGTPLNYQTKTIAVSADAKYWANAGIEGRIAANAFDEKEQTKFNFTFRCHRDERDANKTVKIWTVNDLNFHPVKNNVLASVGSDGTFVFWDLIGHSRLKYFPKAEGAITASAFNREGSLFAYAVGYDWSQGYAHHTTQYPRKLMLHPLGNDDLKKN